MSLYTYGIEDANYIKPLFAFVFVMANMTWSCRLPYHMLIKVANKYRETQKCYYIATAINILISIIFVKSFGLIGVAIGTLCAMAYQAIWMLKYCNDKLLNTSRYNGIKMLGKYYVAFFVIATLSYFFRFPIRTYLGWCALAMAVCLVVGIVFLLITIIFYRDFLTTIIQAIMKKRIIKE